MTPTALGFLLWIIFLVVYRSFRALLSYSITMENSLNSHHKENNDFGTVMVLRAVDVVVMAVNWAVIPFMAITLGTLIPTRIRQFLEGYVGPPALVQASLAALFVCWALFCIWRRHVDIDLSALFRPKNESNRA